MANQIDALVVVEDRRLAVLIELDSHAPHELAAEARVIGLHARIDDGDRYARTIGTAPGRRPVECVKGHFATQPLSLIRRKRLAPGRKRLLAHRPRDRLPLE